jgi:hypothetical protein
MSPTKVDFFPYIQIKHSPPIIDSNVTHKKNFDWVIYDNNIFDLLKLVPI